MKTIFYGTNITRIFNGKQSSITRVLTVYFLLSVLFSPIATVRASANPSDQIQPQANFTSATLNLGDLPRPLDFESRVICHQAIEQIYWNHRIWPAENPAPKPDLEQVLPFEELRAKVEDQLRRSAALEQVWQRPITGAQLQAEIDRMVRSTRQPQILNEIFSALNNDPDLIAECLARPVLADRLIYNFYAGDGRSSQEFDAWWAQESGRFSTTISVPDYDYHISIPAQIEAQDDTWTPTPALPEGVYGSTAVWTGIEMIVWGGSTNFGSRYNPATDTWTTTATLNAPSPRKLHTAVWSGSEMIVWGGCDQSTEFCDVSSGGRYDPLTDSWTVTTFTNAPAARMNHTAVWTGSQMIVWGGCSVGSQGNNFCNIQRNDGGVYDPVSDIWQEMSTVGAPDEREYHAAVWADGVMVIWGGYNLTGVNSGGRYDPATDTWQATSMTNAPEARANHSMVWTGSEVIAWGGCDISLCGNSDTYFDTGGRYDPVTDTWTATDTSTAPEARGEHTAVWTGTEMIVWGGRTAAIPYLNTGSRYDPDLDTWIATGTAGAPPAKSSHHAVWTGNEMIVWGGLTESDMAKTGGRYDPGSDSWVPTNTNDPVFAKERHTAVWTGTEMLVWGGSTRGYGEFFGLGIRYDTVTGIWSLMSMSNEPEGRFFHNAVWTGSEMIVWGGHYGTFVFNTGGRYNPMSDSWTDTSLVGGPVERTYHAAVWTGSEMLVWGGTTNTDFFSNSGDRYDPSTDTWTHISTGGAPSARAYLRGVWSGSEMIVWGGYGDTGDTNTGGRYDPLTDSWTSTSTMDAPTGRHFNTAIWTGSEMIVWGGMSGTLDSGIWYNTGGRYDPLTDTWIATSITGAPSARIWQVEVWTGEEMIVWGGCSGSTSCPDEVYTGGRYKVSSDSWMETSIQSMPSERSNASAVWTGTEMIVWGGMAGNVGTYTTTGGIYHVSTVPNTPPVAFPDSYTTEEGVPLNVPAPGVLENDTDEDGNPLSAILVSNPIYGSLALASDGSFTYSPDAGFNGSDSFSYRATDGIAMSNITTVAITVSAVNEAPYFTSTPVTEALSGDAYIYLVTTDDPDLPYGEVLTITATTLPAWLSLTDHGDGSATLQGMPGDAHAGTHEVVLLVSDQGGLQATQAFTITVAAVNDAPYFTSTPMTEVVAGELYTYQVVTDDPDLPYGDLLTITASTLPDWLTLVDNGDGTASLQGTPGDADAGAHEVVLLVSDRNGLEATQTFTITVTVSQVQGYWTFVPVMMKSTP